VKYKIKLKNSFWGTLLLLAYYTWKRLFVFTDLVEMNLKKIKNTPP